MDPRLAKALANGRYYSEKADLGDPRRAHGHYNGGGRAGKRLWQPHSKPQATLGGNGGRPTSAGSTVLPQAQWRRDDGWAAMARHKAQRESVASERNRAMRAELERLDLEEQRRYRRMNDRDVHDQLARYCPSGQPPCWQQPPQALLQEAMRRGTIAPAQPQGPRTTPNAHFCVCARPATATGFPYGLTS
jgi:hypothetical protein